MALFSSKQSLTLTTLIKMGIRIAIVIITVTLLSYWHIMSNLELQVIEQLEKYIVERGQRESHLFVLSADNHAIYQEEFLSQRKQMGNEVPKERFHKIFQAQEDGTVRMRPQFFYGFKQPGSGVLIKELTGFIGQNVPITDELIQRVIINFDMLTTFGPSWSTWTTRFPNLYVIMPEENIIMLYYPRTAWGLEAPTNLKMSETFRFLTAEKKDNPSRKSIWTGVYYDAIAKDWMVSYATPVDDINGQHILTIGHDILLNKLFERTIEDHLDGAYNIIFRQDGRLIVHPDKLVEIRDKGGEINILDTDDLNLINIFQQIKNIKPGQVIIDNTKDNEYLAVTQLEGPDWYFVTVYPKSLLADLAFDTARFILILGLISLLIEIIVLFFVLRQQVAKPLHDLMGATEQITKGNFETHLDVTRQDELGHLAQSFNAMSHEVQTRENSLRKANQLKDEFLANTSHELRTPLNGIIGIAESLREGVAGELSAPAKTNLSMIVSSGQRLSTLVNDILDFAKLKHKTLELQLKSVGLREIVEIVLTLSQPLLAKKTVKLHNAIALDLPAAEADENRVQQILYNLVGNAIKFTENGTIEIKAQVVNKHVEITVSDTGIGIPEDKQEIIFESFEQLESGMDRSYSGTGLGLAVTKRLVELHRGNLWVKSTLGVGSQFTFTLPISTKPISSQLISQISEIQAPIDLNIDTLVHQPLINPSTSGQFKILIVDDEPVNRQVVANFLSLEDYNIIQATSGIEAITLIEKGLIPDAILLDVMMPRMTGYEVTQKLRDKWQLTELPILLLTAKNQVEDLVIGLEVGANDYLTKPISKDELLARIKMHLSIKRLREENLRMSAELDVARHLQQMLLPTEKELQQIDSLDIASFMEPADEVGGDYYDVLQHNGRILFGIGDVTGHGLESGALAIMVQSSIRTLLANHETNPVKFFSALNQMVFHNVQRMNAEKSLTLALVDYFENQLYLSGQHEEIIVVRNGELELIDTIDLGFPIGLDEEIGEFVHQTKVPLNAGDVVVLYTDGITEAINLEKKEYQLKRLCEIIKQNWQKTAQQIREAVIDDVRQFIGEQKVFDDITLLVLKQK
jgi:signal transduction histidine kinase/serine phosphatase RsbU (regulator of sigma subunit)